MNQRRRSRAFRDRAASLTVAAALVAAVMASPASASPPAKVTFTGTTTCSIVGKVTFQPPLMVTGNATSKANVIGNMTGCTNARQHRVKLTGGQLAGLTGMVSPNVCSPAGGPATAPSLSKGSVRWTPSSKVTASHGITFPPGTVTIVTSGGNPHVQMSYLGGTVGSGSFTTSGGASATLTSTQTTTQLQAKCANGLAKVPDKGTVTL